MTKIAFSRTLSRVESLVGVLLALVIPVAAAGGSTFVEYAATVIR